jgi:hypothetical protein
MTFKVGNTEINTVSIIEPYGDDLTVIPDEPLEPWVRPSHWLNMPVIGSGSQKCAFLIAIVSGESRFNRFGFSAIGNVIPGSLKATDFTVDWGDGTTHICNELNSRHANTIPNEQPRHDYLFEDLDPATQFEDGGATYRQAMVIFDAPLSGISTFNWKVEKTNVLEFNINLPSGTYSIGGNKHGYNEYYPRLEKARINAPAAADINYYFNNSPRLRSVEFGDFPNVTGAYGLFDECFALDYVPDIYLPSCNDYRGFFRSTNIREYNNNLNISNSASYFASMFAGCRNLKKVHIDMPAATNNIGGMFQSCGSLISVSGNFNTPNVTTASTVFSYCGKLVNIPDVNLSSATGTKEMFYYCRSLNGHIRVNAPSARDAERMFNYCTSIDRVTIEDLSASDAYNFNSMFAGCTSLRTVELENPNIPCNSLNSMFNGCSRLEYVGSINLSGNVSLNNFFDGCGNLRKVETLKTPTTTSFRFMFRYCGGLKESPVSDIAAQGTGNVDCDSMFHYAYRLKKIPDYDYSRVSNFDEMFFYCTDLTGPIENLDFSNIARSTTTNANAAYRTFTGSKISSINNMILPVSGYFNNTFTTSDIKNIYNIVNESGYNYSTMFNNAYYLDRAIISGVNISIGYQNCPLTSGVCSEIIENLASGVVGQTLSLTNAPGAQILHPDTISIATSKGWTVTT